MEVTVLLAAPRSFCVGVERAAGLLEQTLRRHGPPVYVRRPITPGPSAPGVIVVDELDQVPDGATVVFGAHGVAPAVRADAARRGLHVVDATCPLVTGLHAEARRLAARGDTVLLIGHASHDEVQGVLGQVPGGIQLVQDVAAVDEVLIEDPRRVSYLIQTTLAADETGDIVDELRARFPRLSGPDPGSLCSAATDREDAVAALARRCDLVLVAGSADSPSCRRLAAIARRAGTPAHLIEKAGDIRPGRLAAARTIGLAAAASAPRHLIDEVIAALAPAHVTEHRPAGDAVSAPAPRGTPAGSSRVPA
jgi:4-hydroxy-3-methylbut-2-enyl diphosphate reductase